MIRYTLILLSAAAMCFSAEYYVNSSEGNDNNSGTSPQKAFKTLEKANSITLKPGDKLLFKAGEKFAGHFKPQGCGEEGKRIHIGSYGEGDKPKIAGGGRFPEAVHLFNMEYVTLEGLAITNTGSKPEPGRRGLRIELKDFGEGNDIRISNLFIHDVNGSKYKKKKGGGSAIIWQNHGKEKKTRFDGLVIENCHLKDCVRNGMNSRGYTNRENWHPSLNVVVRDNLLEGIPGDGIVPIGCDGALIEGNVMRDCPRMLEKGDAAAGIWPWSSDNTIIQYNEVSDHKACWDGQGFDSDWNCRGTIIQYNYSHDNEGGFLLICCNGGASKSKRINDGTIVRYNISINDGLRTEGHAAGFSPTFHISGPVTNTRIYNNLIYVPRKNSKEIDRTIVEMDNWGGPYPENTLFANNIFYVEGKADFIMAGSRKTRFMNNLYSGEFEDRPKDSKAITDKPRFKGSFTDENGLWNPMGFQLAPDSPGADAGMYISGNGGKNYKGKKLDYPINVGAF
ncbi:hypothetical protein L21SP3_01049 [Sedimentisphaera cyanobacteriorum]|uniref:Right handed beta helix domain-containing protein n=1 Tax=Sedimentisphaera cyanobacteriorum TaxID=1940790 RepID=A0A1Q2HP69_9BACT|nr:right-handed parallel beta-helix repeat-containing protein [Sedimentisphaera cyanobacteriorum]AQQ09247.1 hypothetical protein L21SP3_01049 [Sedimentisphaera cyanobacteriorum]